MTSRKPLSAMEQAIEHLRKQNAEILNPFAEIADEIIERQRRMIEVLKGGLRKYRDNHNDEYLGGDAELALDAKIESGDTLEEYT